ncbi:MAG: DUF3857 domain-containing protein [Bacteroidia bacterium]
METARNKENKVLRKIAYAVLLVLPSVFVYGQKDNIYAELRKKYADENAVCVSQKENVEVKFEKGQLVIYNKHYTEVLLLTDKTPSYTDNVGWSSFSEIEDLDARSLIPDGGSYKTMKVKNFSKTNEISEGTFYDDYHSYQFIFPGLTNGSRTILSYTEKLKDPHFFFGDFYFGSGIPINEAEYSITFPSNVKIHYKLFHTSDSALSFTSKVSGKNTTYTWRMQNIKKIKEEDNAPSFTYYVPGLLVFIDQYTEDDKTVRVFADTNDFYNWNYSLVKDINTTISPEIKHVVDSITNGATSDLDKVKRIFYWVQDQITYIAYEDSLGGIVPRQASLVCSRRFGDCKDMAFTLAEMIRAAGLEAYPSWIGTRDIPYTFEDAPSKISTNHVICTYINDGNYYFLDATGKNSPFNFPTSMIQGKETMLDMGENKYRIVKIPVLDTGKNIYSDSIHMQLDKTLIKARGILTATGYNKEILGWGIQNADKKNQNKYMSDLLQKGNNKFMLDSSSCKNLADLDKELAINYSFSLEDYVQQNGNELYINMQLEKPHLNDLLDADRQAPRNIEFKSVDKCITTLDIPKGYKVTYLPENTSYNSSLGGFKINYSVKGNVITDESYVYLNTLMINPSDFNEWNKMIRTLSRAYNESVTLSKQ